MRSLTCKFLSGLLHKNINTSPRTLTRSQSDSTGGDWSQAVWLPQRLKVTHMLHLHLEHHGESRIVTSVLESGEMWLLFGIVVFDDPHRSDMYLIQQGEVFIGRAAPREARVLQGGANLRRIEDF
ncbi:hypothetical protein GWK47_046920 [Chionoecetes opilio]|uniref:Uncharacterized protein n=1 Tax=Chionoecetes opilio TaxID=41210 RepID=A0A8J4Y490_CHIOP|nr:hypothetical protein GWK47_046920 [Chionoecetes opilio]